MPRSEGRQNDQLRTVKVTKDYICHPAGSCLIEFGQTKVICSASVEEDVPPFLRNSGAGWVTAEYGMLPCATNTRNRRDKTMTAGRTLEIQRLIGRSLRAVVDRSKLGERTVKVDCDVIQADGGTRTAAITGGYIALALAVEKMLKQNVLDDSPLTDQVAAISVGMFNNQPVLDLNYEEDSNAQMDMNVVMVGNGDFVEVQGTAEGKPFNKQQLDDLLDLARAGIEELLTIQKNCLV
ncbi:MAG: ribonuclease PH [Candidatus Omnitrophica bacterium]|nr:ribonuclease PH [Candidatus Omnitrophota bacterium]MCB9719508.1 ribonuclease PH [Candidatus Omnitrophota bacterium]